MYDFDLAIGWDCLDEKLVQSAIHKRFPNLEREVKLGSNYVDFLSSKHYCIELKKCRSDKGSRYLTRPSHAIGQVTGYQSEYSYVMGLDFTSVTPVILLYGSSLGRWMSDEVTRHRERLGVKLWVLVSLANPTVIDVDTNEEVFLGDL